MAQHFLLTAAARTVSLKQVLRMEEAEAWTVFCSIRWPETNGAPVCPHCACPTCWACPRSNGAPRFRCKACRRDFSPTSGTLFAFHKLEIRDYLAAVVIFCDEVKGKAALALARDLGVQYKTAFVLAHKLREAMAAEVKVKGMQLGGAGRHVEIDGCHVGGHVRPANRRENRKDRRLKENRSPKRQVVVVIRERALAGTSLGGTLPAVFASEDAATRFIKARVDRASTVHADESPAWNTLHARFDTRRINHSVEYANDDACTNQAEAYFARLRRGEIGHHHRISGAYLIRYAREAAWKEDHRRDSNGLQVRTVILLVSRSGPSVDFCGYWQRHRSAV
jgi:transposase-like protein